MSYPPAVAAALSGATLRQLSYWRSPRARQPLLSPELHKPRSRVSYSFQDVVALRTFVYLRAAGVSLQRVRKAVEKLRALGEIDHLSQYKLVAVGRDVVWRVSDDEAVDLTGLPGQSLIAEMVDIVRPFRNEHGKDVVDLFAPTPGVRVDPEIRGGFPVIEGTRVPYDVVAGLIEDGLSAKQIQAIYPSIEEPAVQGAADFARYVGGQHKLPRSA